MFTAGLIAALISAAVAGATAIGKGVQSHKQKKERKEEQSKVTAAMETAAGQTAAYREESREESMEGLRRSYAQMQPIQDAMARAYPGAYQAPDMSWLYQQPRTDTGQGGGGNEPRANVGGPTRGPGTVRGPLSPAGAPANSPLGGVMQEGQDKWGHSAGGLHRR